MNIYNNNYYNVLKEIDDNIIWQYDNSSNLKKLIEFKKEFVKNYHCDFWKNFEKDIFNIDTANDFGLTIWGLLLNVSNIYFVNGIQKTITTETYRMFLKGRLYYMLMNGSTPDINKYLKIIIGDKEIYNNTILSDLNKMTINYILGWEVTEEEKGLYFNTDILPRPAGVKLYLYEIDPLTTFGFFGSELQPFNQGVFWDMKSLNNN